MVVKMTTPGEWNPVAVEYKSDEYTQNVTTEGKEGYLSQTGDYWQNTEEEFGTNVCLKAYTNEPLHSAESFPVRDAVEEKKLWKKELFLRPGTKAK